MWIKKPKIHTEYIGYKNNLKKYIERSAQFKPVLDCDITLNEVILNKVNKWCSFILQMPNLPREKKK